jgi:hypothetical protein
MKNRMGSITEQRPISYQEEKDVKTNFVVNNKTISFELENFDNNKDLVIDPGLIWATYYGGYNEDGGYSCAVDVNGNVYLAGYSYSTIGIASSGHQNAIGGDVDAFLVKFNSLGVRQWATYYGGGFSDGSNSCAIDVNGNVYLAGTTSSTGGIAFGGHQNTFGGGNYDAFLVKFNSNGVRQWATYYGGLFGGDVGYSCTTDGSGNVYLAGYTESTNNIASGGHLNTYGGNYDAFLVKFNSNGARQWATYYGGIYAEFGYSCAVDTYNNIYLTGRTISSNNIASGGHQNVLGGGNCDAFLVKFNSLGVRQWATYYGGSNWDVGYSCAIDGSGNVYLTGFTNSINGIASGGHQNVLGGINDGFLVKFNSNGVRQWGTYYGSNQYEDGQSCSVDKNGNVYLAGYTSSTTSIASGGHQNIYGDLDDAYLVKFNSNGIRQWATYYGGFQKDRAFSCTLDNNNVYLAGYTSSTTSIASGGYQNIYGLGTYDAFLAKLSVCSSTFYTLNITSCVSFYWADKDKTYTSSNITDTVKLINSEGCDSIITLNLTIKNSTSSIYATSACGSFYWADKDKTYTSSNNTDTVKLINSEGCDSIITLNLTIKNSTSSTLNASACDSFYWAAKNKTYTSSNNSDTILLSNSEGCDSVITLNLTVKNSSSSTLNASACGSFHWAAKNKTYTSSNNSDTILLSNSEGCDSVVTLNLTVKNSSSSTLNASACGSFYWAAKNKTYTSSNNSDTILLSNSEGCDSVVTLNLTIYPIPNPTIVKINNVLSTQTYNNYQWLKNGLNINGAIKKTYTVTSNASYKVIVTDANNCRGTSASLNVIVSSLNEVEKDYFKIYPNPSEKMLHIETNESENWQAIITDSKGAQINQIQFQKSTQLDINNYAPGVYYIQLTSKEEVLNYKFIKK